MVSIPYLRLDSIKANRPLMRLLPPEVAYRYHALPVATDGYRITVAVASPGESSVSAAISSAICAPICFVQADLQEIDQCLDKIWKESSTPRLRLLFLGSLIEEEKTHKQFAQILTRLFDADIIQVDITWQGIRSFLELRRIIEQIHPDLLICPTYPTSWSKQDLLDPANQVFFKQITVPLFLPRNLCLPLEKILLVLPDSKSEGESSILWTVQVSRSNQAAVSVLPLLPQVPSLYGSFIKHDLKTIFMANDPLGQKMRSIADKFSEGGIQGTFKLRDGEPNDQLRDELGTSNPDLVIIASDSRKIMPCIKPGDPVNLLLNWDDRPLLIT